MNQWHRLWQVIMSRRYFPVMLTIGLLFTAFLSLYWIHTSDALTIQNSSILLRSEPNTNSKSLMTLEQKQVVHVLNRQQNWLHVRAGQRMEGWLPEWLVTNSQLTGDQGLVAQVKQATKLYKEASTSSEVLSEVATGKSVDIVSESLGWAVVVSDNQQGYIATQDLTISMKQVDQKQAEVIHPDDVDITNAKYVQVRASSQAFHASPSLDSNILYNPDFNQRFKYLKTVTANDGTEFYQVQDDKNRTGYVESRIVAFEDASDSHVGPIATTLKGAVIVLDAGHGGTDPGAINQSPYTEEKSVTLASTNMLKQKLESLGATVKLTRQTDTDVSLKDRAALSNQEEADIFISLHFDGANTPDVSGVTTYYYHTSDETLANLVNSELAKIKLQNDKVVNNNGVLFGNYYVLRENHQPSILLELGYMTNQQDIEMIQSQYYYEKVADAIATGLEQYLQSAQHRTQ